MSEFQWPDGWIEVEWEGLTSADGFRRGPFGGNLKKSMFVEEGYAVYEQYAPINDDCSRFRYFIEEDKYQELASFWVEGGDFLVSCSGTMGRITQVPEGAPKGVINQALLRIRLVPYLIDPNYFIKLFRAPEVQERVLLKSGGGAIQNLAAVKELKKIPLPLPPLAEQKVIAEKLDTLLAQVETTKARLESTLETLKQFRQSVLAAAVSGKLTEEWREDIGFHLDGWESTNIGELAEVATGKTPKRTNSAYWDSGIVPWLTSSATGEPYIYSAEQFVTELAVKECTLKLFPVGTLLLAMYGEGKTRGQVTEMKISAACNQACAAILVNSKKANSDFIKIRLQENYEETRKAAEGGAQPNLNLSKVRNISVSLPSIEEQSEIVRRVEQLFASADATEQQVTQALERVNNLTQSILAKAFRGELTEQWRKDNLELITGKNSADSLLEKIKAERVAVKTKKKVRAKKRTPRQPNKKTVSVYEKSVLGVITEHGRILPQQLFDDLKESYSLHGILKEVSTLLANEEIAEEEFESNKYLVVKK